MKTIKAGQHVAQGAKVGEELRHFEIMQNLKTVRGFVDAEPCINGKIYFWNVKTLSNAETRNIILRANHEEIMFMFQQYANALCPPDVYPAMHHVKKPYFDEDTQVLIALNCNRDEFEAYTKYWGFGQKGQEILLNRNNGHELIRYVNLHGLLPEFQLRLHKANAYQILDVHIYKHGLCSELLDEIFAEYQKGNLKPFLNFFPKHEFPPKHQIKMLEIVSSEWFKYYTNMHGFWEEVHDYLLEYRSMDDVEEYLGKHPYLSASAERLFAARATPAQRKNYFSNKPHHKESFIQALLGMKELDYDTLTFVFQYWKPSAPMHISLVRSVINASHEEIMQRVNNKTSAFYNHEFVALFFRNNKEEFETCIKNNNYSLF